MTVFVGKCLVTESIIFASRSLALISILLMIPSSRVMPESSWHIFNNVEDSHFQNYN